MSDASSSQSMFAVDTGKYMCWRNAKAREAGVTTLCKFQNCTNFVFFYEADGKIVLTDHCSITHRVLGVVEPRRRRVRFFDDER